MKGKRPLDAPADGSDWGSEMQVTVQIECRRRWFFGPALWVGGRLLGLGFVSVDGLAAWLTRYAVTIRVR